jgi:predicted phage terminase large subunit-like protein
MFNELANVDFLGPYNGLKPPIIETTDEQRLEQRIKCNPQEGPQTAFIESPAYIVIYGGGAFGGKTTALLMSPIKHLNNPKFKAVIFRRTCPQITVEGGLWDEASNYYPLLGGIPKESSKQYKFASGATVRFAHLQHEKDRFNWQGSQVPLFAFDELTHFTKKQFEYLVFSRGRSDCGVAPYVRATCNPEPDSFVAELVSWWIGEDGYPIPARSGRIRWFVRDSDEYVWSNKPDDLQQKYPNLSPKSFTFIAAKITDNLIGVKQNPDYLSSLQALPLVDRERLLNGNWKIRESAGMFFQRGYFSIVDAAPAKNKRVRYWDRAATVPSLSNKNPDWTAGVLLSRDKHGTYYIEHVERFQGTPATVENVVKTIAGQDGGFTQIGIEQDPGSAGKSEGHYYTTQLSAYDVRLRRVSKNKITRAKPASAQAEAGNIKLVRGPWNEAFLNELENFPDGGHDDQVDALSGAFAMINEYPDIFVG